MVDHPDVGLKTPRFRPSRQQLICVGPRYHRQHCGLMYELDPVLDDVTVDPGTNLLISGPPLSGKRKLGMELLADGANAGEGSVIVTTRDSADRVLADYRSLLAAPDDTPFGVVMRHGRAAFVRADGARLPFPRPSVDGKSPLHVLLPGTSINDRYDTVRGAPVLSGTHGNPAWENAPGGAIARNAGPRAHARHHQCATSRHRTRWRTPVCTDAIVLYT